MLRTPCLVRAFALCLLAVPGLVGAQDLQLQPGRAVPLGEVDFKGAKLAAGAQPALDQLGEYLVQRPELKVQVSVRTVAKSLAAADLKAKAVRARLIARHRLKLDRVTAKGERAGAPAENDAVYVLVLTSQTGTPTQNAAGRAANWDAVLGPTRGKVETRAPWDTGFRAPEDGEQLYELQRLSTGPGAQATLTFNDKTQATLAGDTVVVVGGGRAPKKRSAVPRLEVVRGQVSFDLGEANRKSYVLIATPAADGSVGMRGQATVTVDGSGATTLGVSRGNGELFAKKKAVKLAAGTQATVEKGEAPGEPRRLEASSAVATATPTAQQEQKDETLGGFGLDLSEETQQPEEEAAPIEPLITQDAPPTVTEDVSAESGERREKPREAESLLKRLHAAIALSPGLSAGLPNPYFLGELELRGSFSFTPMFRIVLGVGGGERLLLGTPAANSPRYALLGTLHATLAGQALFGRMEGAVVELGVKGWRYTAGAAELGYLTDQSALELNVAAGWRFRLLDRRTDVLLRGLFNPGAQNAFGAQLVFAFWVL